MDRILYHELGRDKMFRIWHALEDHLIIYMCSDGGSIVCSEKTYPIKKGTLCFIGAGKYHYTMPDIPEEYDRSKVHISKDFLSDVPNANGFLKKFTSDAFIYAFIPEEKQDDVDALFEEMDRYKENAQYNDAITFHAVIKLLVLIDQYSLESTQATVGFINKAIDYICDNIFHDLTIDEICAAIHVSKYHFCRTFRSTMNMTVMDYILKTRIVMAESMLRKDTATVTEISERCGFSSISYFCRAFKKEVGRTPLEYRKNMKSQQILD